MKFTGVFLKWKLRDLMIVQFFKKCLSTLASLQHWETSNRFHGGRTRSVYMARKQSVFYDYTAYENMIKQYLRQRDLDIGKKVHSHMLRTGFMQNVCLINMLLDGYVRCQSIEDARQLFDEIIQPNEFSYSYMITGLVRSGYWQEALELFRDSHLAGRVKIQFNFASVIKACVAEKWIFLGQQIHALVLKFGCISDVYASSGIIDLYAKSGLMDAARKFFDEMPNKNSVSWTALMAGFVQHGKNQDALILLREFLATGMQVDCFVIGNSLRAAVKLGFVELGMQLHGLVIVSGFGSDIDTLNLLISMYGKCRRMSEAQKAFDIISHKNSVSWIGLISGFAHSGHGQEALFLFRRMVSEGYEITDPCVVSSVLAAAAGSEDLESGRELHAFAAIYGLDRYVSVENSLVTLYLKCGRVGDACTVFQRTFSHDIVSWTAMITGLVQQECNEQALKLFGEFHHSGLKCDLFMFSSVLRACGSLAVLDLGRQIHGFIIQSGFELEVVVGSSLIDMYAKCGEIETARMVFDCLPERNVFSWTIMVLGYAQHGQAEKAIEIFRNMQEAGIRPDHVTFFGVLSACTHSGLFDEAHRYFEMMTSDYAITPGLDHYGCMIDLLARSGHCDMAKNLIGKMPYQPDAAIWESLLSACRFHGNTKIENHAAEELLKLESECPTAYLSLAPVHSANGKWDESARYRKLVEDKGVNRHPGQSWIEVKNKIHAFVVGLD